MPTITVTLKGRELQRHVITRVTTTIGRDLRCDITIDNPALSRHHATIQCHRGMFGVRDEGSANGIFVNGEQVQGARLSDGDVLSLGKFQFEFQMVGGPSVTDLLPDDLKPFDIDTHNPEQTMAISLVDLKKMVAQRDEAAARGRPQGATYSSNQRRAAEVQRDWSPSHHPPGLHERDRQGGGRRVASPRQGGSGGFSVGSAHPLGSQRSPNAKTVQRTIEPQKKAKSKLNPVLVVVIVGLMGLVGLLSAGLAWALFFR